jgi:hypothetical protein
MQKCWANSRSCNISPLAISSNGSGIQRRQNLPVRACTHNSSLRHWARQRTRAALQAQPHHGPSRHHPHSRKLACLRPELRGQAPVQQAYLGRFLWQLPGRRRLHLECRHQGRAIATIHPQRQARAPTVACLHLQLQREDRARKLHGNAMVEVD